MHLDHVFIYNYNFHYSEPWVSKVTVNGAEYLELKQQNGIKLKVSWQVHNV